MANPLDNFLNRFRRTKISPTKTLGAPGVAIYGGFIATDEKNTDLASRQNRYKTFSDILANTSIVAAGTRYFLNLVAKADWTFIPSDADTDGKFADLAEKALTADPSTSWARIIRRAAMYRFYGFSIQEWTARRGDDGMLTFSDVAPRAQLTIDKWDLDIEGNVLGVVQCSPQTSQEIYLPRPKLLYIVDDTLSDSPEGVGLFRHVVAPAKRLERYEQLEGVGFETDLRGIPIGRAPFTKLTQMVKDGDLSQAQRTALEKPILDFIKNHIKTPSIGAFLDSVTYETHDEAGRPSNAKQWDIELLKGSSTSFAENAAAIERVNRELARILGVEQMMLGSSSGGSFALSRDKTSAFFLLVDGALQELQDTVTRDLLRVLWKLNGWPDEMMPGVSTEAVKETDVEQIAATLRDMATAGAVLSLDDPAIGEIRDLMGISRPPDEQTIQADEDASLTRKPTGSAEEDKIPEDENLDRKE